MNEFESDWTSLSQSFVQNGWIQDGRIQDGRIQDGCHYKVNWIELVWVRVRVEWECFWVNLREDKKVFESKMAVSESNMAEVRMAAIIKLSQNEWVKFFLCNYWEPILARVSEFERRNYDGWIQDGQLQDDCLLQVKWEWMSLSQIDLVWVRVLCKMADSKMAEYKMAEFKMVAII